MLKNQTEVDPSDPGYQCPWTGGATSTLPLPSSTLVTSTTSFSDSASSTSSITSSSTSTASSPGSYPTEYYDEPTAAGCANDGCTECAGGFKMACTKNDHQKVTYCHCEWLSGCDRNPPNLGKPPTPFSAQKNKNTEFANSSKQASAQNLVMSHRKRESVYFLVMVVSGTL